VVDVGRWWNERPRRAPAEYARALAAADVLAQGDRVFVETSPEVDETADLLRLETELAHALVLALQELPAWSRRTFAAEFYAGRRRQPSHRTRDARDRLRIAATAAEVVFELVGSPALGRERIHDLLVGAAQNDDVSTTPEPAVSELRGAVAAARREVADADPFEAPTAATLAVVEVLDPASGEVALREVLLRTTWAALRSWPPGRVARFLRAVDEAFGAPA
jgi:hypothetical protein